MISLLLSFAIHTPAQASIETALLARFRWKKRVLVLLSSKPEDQALVKEKSLISSKQKQFDERDLIVIEESDAQGPLHHQMKVAEGFSAVLIGKDGGEKWRSHSVFEPHDIFAQIDQMPMRKAERGK